MPQLYLRGDSLGIINCILFDKDGTLINSEDHLLNLANCRIKAALKICKHEQNLQFKALQIRDLLREAYGVKGDLISPTGSLAIGSREQNLISTATILCLLGLNWPKSIQLAYDIFKSADLINYKDTKMQIARPILTGASKLIKSLREEGFKLAIITNDDKAGVEEFLTKNNMENDFQYCWSSEDIPSKPNPNAIKKLCKILQVKSSECAIISDSDTDLLMAKENNIKLLLGYTAGWRKPPLLYEHDHLIHHWDEISYQSNHKIDNVAIQS